MKSLLTHTATEDAQGTTLAAVDVVNSMCGVVAPAVGGILLDRVGAANYPWCAAVAYTALVLLTAVVFGPGVGDLNEGKRKAA
jgi:predicted MFS family arabinose efflux permease